MNTHTSNYGAQGKVQVSRLVFHMASVVLIILVVSHDVVSCGRQIVLLQLLCANNEETKFSPAL